MNNLPKMFNSIGVLALSAFVLSGCATSSKVPSEVTDVRNKLMSLQADSQLASRAPVALKEAEVAVQAAEKVPKDKTLAHHLVWVADHKIDIASAQAQARLLEDQRKGLSEARETARLDSRTREADLAHGEADRAKNEADRAKGDADAARKQAEELQRQIAELNAKATDRGLVVTLGDLLFETNKSELKGGAASNLSKLSAFLTQYPDRTVTIEGHTDSVGPDDYNLSLSQRRANSVQQFLIAQGIASNRLTASGKGENFPVASNDSGSGRQMNRRVEVIIANTKTAAL
jgi:outer membrane protein OmpA-like peptidoglycan-associated protein